MKSQNAVEVADDISRRRALLFRLVAVSFLAIEIVVRPVFRSDGYAASGWRLYAWPLNTALLLLLLIPAGGLFWGRRVRALVNDEIARNNARIATATGFWLAMTIALVTYVLPVAVGYTAREAIFVIVTPTTAFALFAFAWLESRALRDG